MTEKYIQSYEQSMSEKIKSFSFIQKRVTNELKSKIFEVLRDFVKQSDEIFNLTEKAK